MSFERKNIKAMTGYTSGEQPESAGVIKLNTNENPYPPGPAVARALDAITVSDLRRYPPPTAMQLRKSIAALHQVDPNNTIVTNGGDELLRLAIATYVENAEAIAVAEPSYSLYEVLANAHGCGFIRLDLNEDWMPPADFAAQLNNRGAKMAFLVNPHAPSGTLLSVDRIRAILTDFRGVLVLDEAYVDFVTPDAKYNSIPLLQEFDNLLILRTLSKGYSLAGLRMAYGLGAPSLISPMLNKTRDSYNTDYIAQKLAQAALEDQDYARDTWQQVRQERSRVARELAQLGFNCPPSESNFVLATVPPSCRAREIYQALKEHKILLPYFDLPRLDDKLRITIGTESENRQLLETLKAIV